MEIDEILSEFERVTGKFPRAAVTAAIARRDEITPELLRILEDTVLRAGELAAPGDYQAHIYAMFLLAQFRETRAYPLVVRFALLPSDVLESLGGEFLTGDFGQVLASVCGRELARSSTSNRPANSPGNPVESRLWRTFLNCWMDTSPWKWSVWIGCT